jgi:hypothetical protein
MVVPCADMANHSGLPNAGYQLDTGSGLFQLVALQVTPGGGWCRDRDGRARIG